MILYTHNMSPFGRKVRLAASVLRLNEQIEARNVNTSDSNDPIRSLNPLGKMPVLVDGKETIYDSRVILEYMNYKAKDVSIFPMNVLKKMKVLVELARINGMMDAAVLIVYEARLRPKKKIVTSIVDYQREKIIRGLIQISDECKKYTNNQFPDACEIGLASCLDYLDLRKQLNWRDYAPDLEFWIKSFSKSVPGYFETSPNQI